MIRQNFINRGQRLSPSARKIIKLRQRATQSGAVSLELQIPTNYIREMSRDLNYDTTSDASLIMTPNTIGESRLFNCKPNLSNSDFQVTRATTATVVQKDGSISDSCYNLFTFSQDFSNSAWTKDAITQTANATTSPNGVVDAAKLATATANNTNRLFRSTNLLAANTTYTHSFYVKAAELNFIHIRWSTSAGNMGFCVNLTTAAITQGRYDGTGISTILPTTYSALLRSDGWIYVTYTATNGTTTANPIIHISPSATTTATTVIGNGVYFWGPQLLQGSIPKDYLKTTNRLNVPSIDYSLGSDKPALLVEPQRTNIIFPSATATTQSRTVTAQPYTLSFYGTGTVTLSGVFSGSLVGTGTNNLVSLTFTPTAGSLTFTITGTVTNWQCEAGTFLTSRITTTTATATRNAYTSFVDMFNNSLLNKDNFTLFIEGYIDFRHSLNPWLGLSDSSTIFTGNSLYLYNGNAVGYYVGGARTDIALTTADQVYFKTVIKKSGTSLKVFTDGVLKATDTLAVFDYRYLIINDGSARNFVQKLSLWKRTLSDADCILLTS